MQTQTDIMRSKLAKACGDSPVNSEKSKQLKFVKFRCRQELRNLLQFFLKNVDPAHNETQLTRELINLKYRTMVKVSKQKLLS